MLLNSHPTIKMALKKILLQFVDAKPQFDWTIPIADIYVAVIYLGHPIRLQSHIIHFNNDYH